MKKAPKVLTRMRLSCCWGDNLNEKELNDVVDYINDLEQQCEKQKEVIDKAIKYIKSYKTDYIPYELSDYNIRQILDILNEVSK